VDFDSVIDKYFLTILVFDVQKASLNFLDIVHVKLKIHYTV